VRTATALSWVGALLLSLVSVGALAQPPMPPSPAVEGKTPESNPGRRHFIAMELGGAAFVQGVYRFRALGPLHLEIGAFGAPHFLSGSLGTTLGTLIHQRWFPHLGVGVGAAGGATPPDECAAGTSPCSAGTTDTIYRYARAGLGVAFGAERRHMIAIELAAWRGREEKTVTAIGGSMTSTSRSISWYLPGVAYQFAIF